jgi:hypothetical protein
MRMGGGGSERSFGIDWPTRGERSPNASVNVLGALTRRAEQPTNARGEGPTGLAAIPRNENGPLCRGARVVRRSVADQAASERLLRLPRGTY